MMISALDSYRPHIGVGMPLPKRLLAGDLLALVAFLRCRYRQGRPAARGDELIHCVAELGLSRMLIPSQLEPVHSLSVAGTTFLRGSPNRERSRQRSCPN